DRDAPRSRRSPSAAPTLLSTPRYFLDPPATPEIYTLSLHDALPISVLGGPPHAMGAGVPPGGDDQVVQRGERVQHGRGLERAAEDRKSTRLNSSHVKISYAVFCLKKKNREST